MTIRHKHLASVLDSHMKARGELVSLIGKIARARSGCSGDLLAILCVIGDAAYNRHPIHDCGRTAAWVAAAQTIGLRCDMSDRNIHRAIRECVSYRDRAPCSSCQ